MITDVLLTGQWPTPDQSDSPEVSVVFQLGTPFPYAIDLTEVDVVITDGSTAVVTNAGNAAQQPVMPVAGPATASRRTPRSCARGSAAAGASTTTDESLAGTVARVDRMPATAELATNPTVAERQKARTKTVAPIETRSDRARRRRCIQTRSPASG